MGEYLIISDFIMLGIMSFMTISLFLSIIIVVFMDFLKDKRNDDK